TALISAVFFVVVAVAVVLLVPVLQGQVMEFVANVPSYIDLGSQLVHRLLMQVESRLSADDIGKLREAVGSHAGEVLGWLGTVVKRVLSGGTAFLNVLSLVFITPLVTFYLLRDWPRIVARVDDWLPRDHRETIRDLLHQIDGTLAGFVRGQALVCLVTGTLYALGLSLVGLQFGLLIGMAVGVLTVLPMVGATIGAVVTIGLAALQFGTWKGTLIVAAVFVVVQAIEGNVLSPKLVGDRVGLHPLWIVFALLAGGALFGFLGVVLAVPVAAALGVLARFAVARYLASPYYRGDTERGPVP
ncbi:MAG: AI-2E family transporter, partial [Alphaproteobacteria bacterium]